MLDTPAFDETSQDYHHEEATPQHASDNRLNSPSGQRVLPLSGGYQIRFDGSFANRHLAELPLLGQGQDGQLPRLPEREPAKCDQDDWLQVACARSAGFAVGGRIPQFPFVRLAIPQDRLPRPRVLQAKKRADDPHRVGSH